MKPRTGILATCEELHMHCTGAGDRLSDKQVIDMMNFLDDRLTNWRIGQFFSREYDEAVRNLIIVTQKEVRERPASAAAREPSPSE